MSEMFNVVIDAHDRGKYCFIQDQNGNAATFFKYKGLLFDFYREISAMRTGEQTSDEVKEKLRYNCVEAMRFGQVICVNLAHDDEIRMNEWGSEFVDCDTVFDFKKGRQEENYFKMVMESEKYDNNTKKVNGYFNMCDDFSMVFMTEC